MTEAKIDILCIGNAIVDVIARVDEDFLVTENMHRGAMNLIDESRAEYLSGLSFEKVMTSGGSAANTVVGVASLGGTGAYIGKVKDDALGAIFARDLAHTGVIYQTPKAIEGPASARSFIFVTPDGQRTMNTFLGACQNLTPDDIDEHLVRSADITYLEGYLWDPPAAKEAFIKASSIAHAAGKRVALTLSDAFCVDRYRDEFLDLIRRKILDIVFANESELRVLYQTADLPTAIAAMQQENILSVTTRSEKGCLVIRAGQVCEVPAHPIDVLNDTTGAGDLFAAGFLYGLSRGRSDVDCARLAALAAAEVIQHIGPRPKTSLRRLAQEAGLERDDVK